MAKHGAPEAGMECACCYDDIDGENYVEYCTGEGKEWLTSLFCEMCVTILTKRQWPIYEETLAKANCKAQQKRMLGEGPPTHVHDKKALPCPDGESVHSLWFMRDGEVHSALLEGAPQGEARQIWWDEKLAFQFEEDDEEKQEEGASELPPPPAVGTVGTADKEAASVTPPPPGQSAPAANGDGPGLQDLAPSSEKRKAPEDEEGVGTSATVGGKKPDTAVQRDGSVGQEDSAQVA